MGIALCALALGPVLTTGCGGSCGTSVAGFLLALSPGSRTVTQGQSTTYTATLTSTGGFESSVGLSVSGLPANATGSFNPPTVTPTGTSTLTVITGGQDAEIQALRSRAPTPPGTYTLTVTATGGGVTRQATVQLIVQSAGTPMFTMTAAPPSQSIAPGGSTTYTATLTSVNGFNSPVDLSLAGLPAGATGGFNPATVTPSTGGATSTLTINTTAGTPAGTYPLTITGTGGGQTQQASVTLIVTGGTPANTGVLDTAVDPTGRFLYAADQITRTVSQFRINGDGTLSPLSPPTLSVTLPPQSIRANPAPGSHSLYVGASDNNNGAIYQFNINADGTLTPLNPATPPSTSQPTNLIIDPTGRFLFDIDHNEGIRQFIINADGTLTQNGADVTGGGQLFSAAMTPNGSYLYTSGGPRIYRVNPNGTLSFIGLGPGASGNAEGMSIDPAGLHLYVTFSGVGTGGIDLYNINNVDGTLTTNGPAVPFSQFAYRSAITPDGRFLYVVALNTPANVVAQYAINQNGTITPLSPATVPAGNYTTSVSISPDGMHVYVTNYQDSTVSQYRINGDGTLTPLSPPNVPG